MSPCLGEPMPVVACNIQILSGVRRSIAIPAAVTMLAVLLVSQYAFAQETKSADAAADAVPAAEGSAVPAQSAPPAATAPAAQGDCQTQILAQQKLTRTVRAIRNPLPKPDKATADKLRKSYVQLVPSGFTSPADTKVVQDYLAWQILQASDPEFSDSAKNMQELLKDIEDDVRKAGVNAPGGDDKKERERKKFCAEVLKVSKQLLDNSLDARMFAVRVMQSLHDVSATQARKARLHSESLATLLTVLNDPQQPDSVKTVTASSIRSILVNCDVVVQDQYRVCDSIAKELARTCTEPAFQMVMLDAIFEVTDARRTIGTAEPTVFKVLAAVIDDKSKPLEVRCHAARGIGRSAFDLQMKLDPLAWKITQLAFEAAGEFNSTFGNPKWQECGMDLLLSFRHLTAAEAAGAAPQRKGIMNRDEKSQVIAQAAPFITVVSLKMISNNGKFNAQEVAQLTAMKKWIDQNRPADLKWDSNAPALTP